MMGTTLLSNRRYALQLAVILFLILYGLDILAGVGYSIAAFYCIPIAMITWHFGTKSGAFASFIGLLAALHDFPPASISEVSIGSFVFQCVTNVVLYSASVYTATKFRTYTTQLQQLGKSYEKLAFYDRLTGLPNRVLLLDRIAVSISQARRERRAVLVLYLDLDGFKAINDIHGHDVGDDVLRVISNRFTTLVREGDTVSRVGGDEFVVVIGNAGSRDEAASISKKIIAAVAQPVVINHKIHKLGVSIGISSFPDDGAEIDTLLSSADSAMFASKNAGKNTFTYFRKSIANAVDPVWLVLGQQHEIGVPEIDAQHGEMIRLANRLNTCIENSDSDGVRTGFDELVNFTLFHFSTEERYMVQSKYPHMQAHTAAHQKLIEDIGLIRLRVREGRELIALQTLKDWFFQHVETEDKQLGLYLCSCTEL